MNGSVERFTNPYTGLPCNGSVNLPRSRCKWCGSTPCQRTMCAAQSDRLRRDSGYPNGHLSHIAKRRFGEPTAASLVVPYFPLRCQSAKGTVGRTPNRANRRRVSRETSQRVAEHAQSCLEPIRSRLRPVERLTAAAVGFQFRVRA
jgi:hypothetical protein